MIRRTLLSLFSLLLASQLQAQQIIVNEFYRGGTLSTTDEWIEVVLLQDLSAAQLETYLIGDSQAATSSKLSAYQFTGMAAIAADFPAGTIIVLAGTTGPAADGSYDPANGDWNLVLKSAGANITTVTGGGDLAGTDVVWVDTAATGATIAPNGFCVNYDSTPGVFGAACQVTITAPANNTGSVLGGDVTTDAATAGSWTSSVSLGSMTPGQPNGGTNTTSIDTLRAGGTVPVLSIDSPSMLEGNSGDFPVLTVTATLDAPANGDCAFNVDTFNSGAPNEATAGVDYTDTTLIDVTIPDGQMSTTFQIPLIGDDIVEGDEVFGIEIFGEPSACDIFSAGGIGTIVDDDFALPTVTIDNVSVVEGTGAGTTNAVFTVTLVPANGRGNNAPITVDFSTVDGTALVTEDYTLTSGSLSFAGGVQESQTISVPIVRDNVFESSEGFVVQLSNLVGADFESSQGQGTITNDDGFPVPSIGNVSMLEGTGGTTTFGFTVTLSNPSAFQTNFLVNTLDDTAISPADYTAIPTTALNFPALSVSQPVNVSVVTDPDVEADEQFFVQIFSNSRTPAGTPLATGTGTIVNDDVIPELEIDNVTVLEGTGAGSTNAVFTVTLSEQPVSGPVSVDFATADGMALSPDDYASTSGTLTFSNGGPLTQTISVPIVRDNIDESDESFVVNLSNESGATIEVGQGGGTITDDDDLPTISIGDLTQDEASGNFVFNLSLSNPSAFPLSYQVWTVDGTATSPEDYQGIPLNPVTLVSFAAGSTMQTLTVNVIDDGLVESDESFVVNVANAVPTRAKGTPVVLDFATATITDNDVPDLSISDAGVVEGTGNNSTLVFTLSLSAALDDAVSVQYATSDLSAVAPGDYLSASGTASFASGETSTTVSVTVIGDNLVEATETLQLDLSAAVNATIIDATAIGTISDDDMASLSINDLILPEGSGGGLTPFTFTVSTSNPSATPIQVDYGTQNGTAQNPADFVGASGTLTIPALANSTTLTIDVVADDIIEFDETYSVLLSSPVAASISDGIGEATILDDEEPTAVPTLDSRGLLLLLMTLMAAGGWALRRERLG